MSEFKFIKTIVIVAVIAVCFSFMDGTWNPEVIPKDLTKRLSPLSYFLTLVGLIPSDLGAIPISTTMNGLRRSLNEHLTSHCNLHSPDLLRNNHEWLWKKQRSQASR